MDNTNKRSKLQELFHQWELEKKSSFVLNMEFLMDKMFKDIAREIEKDLYETKEE